MYGDSFRIHREHKETMKEVKDMIDIDIMKRFPGVGCACIRNNGETRYDFYGFSDKESGTEVDERTIFPACYISKFINAICVMKLSEQGRIDIDEPAD